MALAKYKDKATGQWIPLPTIAIKSDIGLPPEAYIIEGECQNRLANGVWDWYIESLGHKITTRDITDINGLFLGSKVEEIPFELNSFYPEEIKRWNEVASEFEDFENKEFSSPEEYDIAWAELCNKYGIDPNDESALKEFRNNLWEAASAQYSEGIDAAYIFYNCENLKSVPKMNIFPHRLNWLFSGCKNLREIPDDFESYFMWDCIENGEGRGESARQGTFDNCYSLRKFPMGFLNHGYKGTAPDKTIYNSLFNRCVSLDEIVDLPHPYWVKAAADIHAAEYYTNIFTNTFFNCNRAKRVTLGHVPSMYGTAQWENQVIDLSLYVGYAPEGYAWRITDYNSGITADKEVKDDATYQALKNDPDWFTCDVAYSRYNHDSAVETINSLPDVHPNWNNIIKFKGDSGSKTDGGAISNLTAEEIAVATEKGWTVVLV